jgi:hypothetical protein
MADLTYDANIRLLGESKSEKWHLDTSGAQTIYKGQPMFIDQDVDALNARGFVDADVVAATDVCLGIAAEGKSVAAGSAETTEIEVYVWPSIIGFRSTVFDNADLGKTVYMSDSATLSETAADNPEIGTLHKVEDGYAYVALTTPKITAGA